MLADDDSDIQESVERFIDTPAVTMKDVGMTPRTELVVNKDLNHLEAEIELDNKKQTSGKVVPAKEGMPIKLDQNCLAH